MEIKNLTLIFSHFEKDHFGKDVFLVPYYLGKKLKCDVDIVYQKTKTNKLFDRTYKKVHFIPIKNIFFIEKLRPISFFLSSLFYLLFNANKISVLMTFHFRFTSAFLCFVYKNINHEGKFYLKVDGGEDIEDIQNNISWIKRHIYKRFLSRIDYISIETIAAYNLWNNSEIFNIDISGKLFLVQNGFDEDLLEELRFPVLPFYKKDNIFITVGRLGAYQKNTEMFLKAIENIHDFRNWKFYFIGPIENEEFDFQMKIDNFFDKNPHLKEHVIFTGPIYNKKQLWEYYNRAKVFVLTSRWEGYATVFSEAYRFDNYIISTDVGGARETIRGSVNNGIFIEQENSDQLKYILEDIIMNDNYFEKKYSKENSDNSWELCLSSLVEFIKNESNKV
jgi:glycosyltransferase involved in cell wall biosynthesis